MKEYVIEIVTKDNTKSLEKIIDEQFSSLVKMSLTKNKDLYIFSYKTVKALDVLKFVIYAKRETDIFTHKILFTKNSIKKLILYNNLKHIMNEQDSSSDSSSVKLYDYSSNSDESSE